MTHEVSATRIPDLVMGHLSTAEAAALRRHLADCGDCRELASTYRSIAEAYAVDADHPSTAALVDFAMEHDALDPEQRRTIAAHVKCCAPCLADVDAVRAVDGDAAANSPSAGITRGTARRATLERWGLVAAGVLLALLSYPAFVGLRHLGLSPAARGPVKGGDAGAGLVRVTLLHGPQRSASAVAQLVELDETRPSVILALEPSALLGLADDAMVRLEIVGPGNAPVYRETFAMATLRGHFNRSGVVALLTPASRLEPGRHVLRVWIERVPDAEMLLEKPFEIVRPQAAQRQSPIETNGPQ